MRKKRPVLLLELLIALTLVALVSVYLIRNPMYQLQKEIEALVDLEADRLWLLKFMEMRQKLPEEWEKYPPRDKKEDWIAITLPVHIPYGALKEQAITKSVVKKYWRWVEKEKPGPDGTKHLCMRYEYEVVKGKPHPVYDFYYETPDTNHRK